MIQRSVSYAQRRSAHQDRRVVRVRRVVRWWANLTVGCHTEPAEIGTARQAQGSLHDRNDQGCCYLSLFRLAFLSLTVYHHIKELQIAPFSLCSRLLSVYFPSNATAAQPIKGGQPQTHKVGISQGRPSNAAQNTSS